MFNRYLSKNLKKLEKVLKLGRLSICYKYNSAIHALTKLSVPHAIDFLLI